MVIFLAEIFAQDVAELGTRLDFSIEQWCRSLAQARSRGKGCRVTLSQAGNLARRQRADWCGSSRGSCAPSLMS